jgi:hypothetical protein
MESAAPFRPLPDAAARICDRLKVPAALLAHLTAVHDAGVELLDALHARLPHLPVDREAVLFGAATHDLGKVMYPFEMVSAGERHHAFGQALLEDCGVPFFLARFARTHGVWRQEADLPLEDLLVALADTVWKGTRLAELEYLAAVRVSAYCGVEVGEAGAVLDQVLTPIAAQGPQRVARQSAAGPEARA